MRGFTARSVLLAAAGMMIAGAANAASLDITGFVRAEPTIRITDDENFHNQYNIVTHGTTVLLDSSSLAGAGGFPGIIDLSLVGSAPVPTTPSAIHNAPNGKTSSDNEVNWFAGRAEVDFTLNVSEQVTVFSKLRAIGQPNVHDEYGDPDYFGADLWSGDRGTLLEFNGDNYMVDLPALYVDYNNGPLWIRAGNQTIAWGEAYFFRVLDVPNGLDLRRHSTLDFAAEEFSDKRIPAPAIRTSYRVTDTVEAEAFVQVFSPTVLPNEETPYNIIYGQFDVYEKEFNDDRWAANVGGRVQAQFGSLGLQAIAVNRKNPDGVFKWTESGDTDTVLGVPGLLGGSSFDADGDSGVFLGVQSAQEFFRGFGAFRGNAVIGGAAAVSMFPSVTGLVYGAGAGTPGGPGGPALVDDLSVILGAVPIGGPGSGINCGGAGVGILDAACSPGGPFAVPDVGGGAFGPGVNGIADPFEIFVLQNSGALGEAGVITANKQFFDLFFQLAGPLVGTVERVYDRENILGGGINYLITSQNQYLDQLILRAEATLTPNKKFTNSLDGNFIEEDEIVAAVVAEKYHRFSQAFPATYFVAQYMFRSESDIFGRHLSVMGGNEFKLPDGVDNSHYISFAFQQPFPSLIWRADLAVLYDVQGGALIQPAVKWKPREQYTLEAFVNILESDGGNDDFAETIEWADEIGIRASFLF